MEHTQNYPTDQPRQDTTSRDQARQVATGDDYISIKETLAIFIAEGRPVTERTLQRYCDKNRLTGQKIMTGEGEKWFVLKSSVFNRLAKLQEFDRLRASRQDATGRGLSSLVAEENATSFSNDNVRHATEIDTATPPVAEVIPQTTTTDQSRPDAASPDYSWGSPERRRHKPFGPDRRYRSFGRTEGPWIIQASRDLSRQVDETVQHQNAPSISDRERELYEQLLLTYKDQIQDLMKDKTLLQEDKKMLVEQLISKDRQIEHFFSSERDTKKLFGSLQNIMTYLWPSSKRKDPAEELPQTFAPVVRDMPDGLDDHREGSGR